MLRLLKPASPPGMARDENGATILEFALLFPVFITLLMGALDIGHSLYMKSILQGQMQRAARGSGLDINSGEASQEKIDQTVRDAVQAIAANATVTFTRTAYRDYTLAQSKSEPIREDGPVKNKQCDDPVFDYYLDVIPNHQYDDDTGKDGQGGGKDAVIYTATVVYPRLFPMYGLLGWDPTVTMKQTAILRNQPYANQADPVWISCKYK